jgi:hypothetical protein
MSLVWAKTGIGNSPVAVNNITGRHRVGLMVG